MMEIITKDLFDILREKNRQQEKLMYLESYHMTKEHRLQNRVQKKLREREERRRNAMS